MKAFPEFVKTADTTDVLQYHIDELKNMSNSFRSRFNEIKNQEVQNEYFEGEAKRYYDLHVFTLNYAGKLKRRLNSIKK